MLKRNYDETNNVYWQIGIVYCSNPETVEYESMGIHVPGYYLEAGYIYVYAGCRGRNNGDDYSGGAPWGVTDLKAAVRYNSEEYASDISNIDKLGKTSAYRQNMYNPMYYLSDFLKYDIT